MSTKVLIADDHGVLRAGLRSLLASAPGLEVVGEAATGDEALQLACDLSPDVLLLDILMPGRDSIEVTRQVHEGRSGTRVLILTGTDERGIVTEALKAGASGYVLKRAVESELLAAIAAVQRGDMYVDPAMMRTVLEAAEVVDRASGEGEALTSREREVLVLLARGMTNAQVAEELVLSVRTVESHRANLMSKLGARNRADLVRYAAEHNLLNSTTVRRE